MKSNKEDAYWDVVSELRYAASRAGRRNEDKDGVGDCSCNNEDEDDGVVDSMVGARVISEAHRFLLGVY